MIRRDSEDFASTTPGQDDRIDPPGGWSVMPPSAPDPVAEGTAPMHGDVPPMHAPGVRDPDRDTTDRIDPERRGGLPTPDIEGQDAPAQDIRMSTPPRLSRFDAWNYPDDSGIGDGADLIGYDVEAIDGHIGTIDEASTQVDDAYLVVDTGHWIFGKKVLLPAGTVHNVDPLDQKVYVDSTKNQIKHAPSLDAATQRSSKYRNQVADYYGTMYLSTPYGTPVRVGTRDDIPEERDTGR